MCSLVMRTWSNSKNRGEERLPDHKHLAEFKMYFSFARREGNVWNSEPVPDLIIFYYQLQEDEQKQTLQSMATLKILLERQYQNGEREFQFGGPTVRRDRFVYLLGTIFSEPGWTNQVSRAKLDLKMEPSVYYPVKDTTNITGLLPLIQAWINDCTTNHQPCNRNMYGSLPTRVLDVGLLGESGVKLYITTEKQQGQYATLSHCWGRKQIYRLTSETQRALTDGILLSELPKTFIDAIVTTRAIGLKYLWIDSLCIIQDSIEDWKAESSRMGEIYRDCFINLAATAASDGDGGLFQSRNAAIIPPVRFDLPTDTEKPRWFVCWPNDLWEDHVEHSFLSARGWVFQERFMSPRILHFSNQVFWECRMSNACETVPTGCPNIEPVNIAHPFTHFLESLVEICQHSDGEYRCDGVRPAALLRDWDSVVSVYSQKLFTKYEDRLIAFSGIVDEMKKALPHVDRKDDFYMCGLWSSQMPYALMWRVGIEREEIQVCESKRVDVVGLPSWSWASVTGPVIPCSWPRIYASPLRFLLTQMEVFSVKRPVTTMPGTTEAYFLEMQAIVLPLGSLDLLGMRTFNSVENDPVPRIGGIHTIILWSSDLILATVYPDDREEYAKYAADALMFAIPVVTPGYDANIEGLVVVCIDDGTSISPDIDLRDGNLSRKIPPDMQNFRRLGTFGGQITVLGSGENMDETYQVFLRRQKEVASEISEQEKRTVRLW